MQVRQLFDNITKIKQTSWKSICEWKFGKDEDSGAEIVASMFDGGIDSSQNVAWFDSGDTCIVAI